MYIGIAGMLPKDITEIDKSVVDRVREAGFTGVSCRFSDPENISMSQLEYIKKTLIEGGVRPVQSITHYESIVSSNNKQRSEGIRVMQFMCSLTRRLGADNLYIRPGSMSPTGDWYAHPLNRHPSTYERLVDSLKQISAAAETEGILLAIEGHVLSPLYNGEVIKTAIQDVGSDTLRFNMDPVNFIGDIPESFDTTSAINKLFDLLGEYTICGHAKDFFIQDKLVVHLEETIIGEGILDQHTFVKRFEEFCPDGHILIEHLPDEDIPKAKSAIDSVAKDLGITWLQ